MAKPKMYGHSKPFVHNSKTGGGRTKNPVIFRKKGKAKK